jgi:hypothetical protein
MHIDFLLIKLKYSMHDVRCGFGVNCVQVGSILLHTVTVES